MSSNAPANCGDDAAAAVLPEGEDWSLGRLVLPGGILDEEGACLRRVMVRELIGADEERLSDRRYRTGAEQVTDFLRHVIVSVEGLQRAVDQDLVTDMLAGDRDYLLLRLRQLTLGDLVQQVLRCPSTACGEKVDVEFRISELAVKRADSVQLRYPFTLSEPALQGDETSNRGELRLPTGRDQQAIAELAAVNPGRANTRLFSRVVLRLGRTSPLDEELVRALPLVARREIAEQIAQLAPGPDLTIEIQCPYCGTDMTYPFDLPTFFFEEWTMNLDTLFREIHHLAFHYHWAERDILAMSRARRGRYLALLSQQLESQARGASM